MGNSIFVTEVQYYGGTTIFLFPKRLPYVTKFYLDPVKVNIHTCVGNTKETRIRPQGSAKFSFNIDLKKRFSSNYRSCTRAGQWPDFWGGQQHSTTNTFFKMFKGEKPPPPPATSFPLFSPTAVQVPCYYRYFRWPC